MMCELRQTAPVPKTCCVLKNSDPLKPQPKNEQLCYREAEKNSTADDYLHHKVSVSLAFYMRSCR